MRDFLIKIKFIEFLSFKLNIEKSKFIGLLRENMDDENNGVFSELSDMFSSSKNIFKGTVDLNGFKIKKKRRFFERNSIKAIAKGKFTQQKNELLIDVEINGFNNMMILFFAFILIFYASFITSFINIDNEDLNFIGIPFIIFHASLMFGIPFFLIRAGVAKLKREIEREFVFLIK